LCYQAQENVDHFLLGCSFSREVWFRVLRPAGFHLLTPLVESALAEWWIASRKRVHKLHRKGFDTLILLVC
jgi:hypothetical protein